MPKWLQTLLALLGLGAKEYVSVKVGAPVATAVDEGVVNAVPLVTELVQEVADAAKKPTPAPAAPTPNLPPAAPKA